MIILRQKMDTATSDMNRMTEDYLKIKTVLQRTDTNNDAVKKENDKLRMQV